MVVFLYRPSPQVPKPSARSALLCYDASTYNVKFQSKQMQSGQTDITWIFVLSLFMAVNTILWTISYPEVRALHRKEEVEEHMDIALETIEKCGERWPGTAAAFSLYSKLSRACMMSYRNDGSHPPSSLSANSPSSLTDANSPSASEHSSATTSSLVPSAFHSSPPQFGYVFDQIPEQITFDFTDSRPPQPSFRSNSIFMSPSTMQTDRRFSYFPPDFAQTQSLPNTWSQNPETMLQPQQSALPNPQIFVSTSHFTQANPFNPHLFNEQSYDIGFRHGSLSQQQQLELMQTLEAEGVAGIDNFMNLSSQYEFPLKFE